uniref:BTB domain-containing protein n=1 Tax=Panagrellus redivivus TaxID=6233 RepID=A0A7E4URB6_PANRE
MTDFLKDSVVVTITDTNNVKSELRPIPGAWWLQWSLHVYPLGKNKDSNAIGVYIRVIGGIDGYFNATFDVCDDYDHGCHSDNLIQAFKDGEEHGIENFYTNRNLVDGHNSTDCPSTIICTVAFKVKKYTCKTMRIYSDVAEDEPYGHEITLVVGADKISISSNVLRRVLPATNSILFDYTKVIEGEPVLKTDVIEITDFTYQTVRNAIDYAIDKDIEVESAEEITEMLRLYKKFGSEFPSLHLQEYLNNLLAIKNFDPDAAGTWIESRCPTPAPPSPTFTSDDEDWDSVSSCGYDGDTSDGPVSGIPKRAFKRFVATIPETPSYDSTM